jgi:octaprenyl-diphosphate synthase
VRCAKESDSDPRITALGDAIVSGIESVEVELLSIGGAPARRVVDQVVAHIIQSPGKHLRALCVFLCASVGRRVYPPEAIQLAAVVELVHGATLLHDDVIDTGERRRGVPTARLLHGELASVLGGDLLMLRASAILLELGYPDLFRELVTTMETIVDAESRHGTCQAERDNGFENLV